MQHMCQMNNVAQVMTSREMLWRDNETNYTSPLFPTSLFVNIAIEAAFEIFISIWWFAQLDDVFLIPIFMFET